MLVVIIWREAMVEGCARWGRKLKMTWQDLMDDVTVR
jgi:hypothetical protein